MPVEIGTDLEKKGGISGGDDAMGRGPSRERSLLIVSIPMMIPVSYHFGRRSLSETTSYGWDGDMPRTEIQDTMDDRYLSE
mmetsp:Transcript_22412/g.22731  ORF Transcript_22412/g.22731 Transcript_22412/m.22731 type:complete len:81 (-) Transcript_22412:5-247(-)